MLKNFCMRIWPQPLFRVQKKYTDSFNNWKEMLKMRPLLRFDGIYKCKMKYYRSGISERSEYNP